MERQILHVFRNTPLGREMLLHTSYFCRQTGAIPVIYLPEHTKFLMYFENDVVQVDLDPSYLLYPETARAHAEDILASMGVSGGKFFEPKHFTASNLPDIPVSFEFMCCPRSISDLSSKIGLGYIGSRVRRIVKSAGFPVLIPSLAFKPFKSIVVMFGGSNNAYQALRAGLRLKKDSGLPLDMFTQAGNSMSKDDYLRGLEERGFGSAMKEDVRRWLFFDNGDISANLYEIPHDALIVIGSHGHGLVKDVMFGSTMEKVQSWMTNSMLIVGPQYRPQF